MTRHRLPDAPLTLRARRQWFGLRTVWEIVDTRGDVLVSLSASPTDAAHIVYALGLQLAPDLMLTEVTTRANSPRT